MNRYAVRIGSAAALALSIQFGLAAFANAAENAPYSYGGKRVVFETLVRTNAGPGVSADDSGLRQLVRSAGGSVTWDADNQYVLVTFPGPTVISFAIGDAHYLTGSVSHPAAFAPFVRDGHAFIPLNDVLRALKLPAYSPVSAGVPAATPAPVPSPVSTTDAGPASPMPFATSVPSPQPDQLAQVTGVDVQTQPGSVTIRIGIIGNGAYEWHRLRAPDNRWWIDVHTARLATAPIDQSGGELVSSVRVRQQPADTVRVALSLPASEQVDVSPGNDGITVVVSNRVVAAATRGSGTFGSIVSANASPLASPAASPGARYVPANPKLIVLDPGHGGSDPGAVRAGLQEKTVTLDIAKRLRDLLVARGWQVVMTRSDDRDVFAPNDSGRDELQARDNVANSRGARLLVSIHVNSYVNSGPHGVATYYYKASDLALAQSLSRRIAAEVGLNNNGVIKDKLWIINHAVMPAALVETAYISNPDDLSLLQSGSWRQKMAQAIADGIVDFTESN
ncbi:MAG TPA: N-acetylmuramoyl-L-alanine amidase [Candidatus Rubrimentiphilum sp.]|nr:N-acetylmuramoyl-L-alanine amidase [Candidatus Rubrimentiphilum sp.]